MNTAWIAVDWGTSKLRAWVMGTDGREIAALSSDQGMGQLAPEVFEPTLVELLAPYLSADKRAPVIACGMVGARQGWAEAPYAAVPCAPPGLSEAVRPSTSDSSLAVHILPGVKQADPPDVMRGEETQIAGFLAQQPDFDGILCLPGTHTKWVQISAGEIVSFRTVMTGELFALLSQKSVLRHSVSGEGWDDSAFEAAINDAMTSPQHLTARLFALRAGALLDGLSPDTARARLSGYLLGLELAGTRPYWLGQQVAIIGAGGLAQRYEAALTIVGAMVQVTDGAGLTLAGLTRAYAELQGQDR
ncbi:2-dehydro-3-deoxygalactonokinase [Primorskyibacter aestuariivivens]|uniref:2-dehydro-3-deoxygalactonokinase n=1 Tax=Primorskyibacter aestuariivivens TaxID=1888912 RepID=UPI0022FFDED1|nr:2-dehydro-3-deoxygalactonokinase [Primorskyibacter aestuariivivens]MDA7429419.1 2-dehydro-3-deoxygalactonokinase [Primorskyibacter aestuariivivens]